MIQDTTMIQTTAPVPGARFDQTKVALLVAEGAFFWFVGIFLVRWAGQAGHLSNAWTPLIYALTLIGTIPILALTPKLMGLRSDDTLTCAAIMAATASLLDAIAVRWTTIYAEDPQLLAHSAASLLWAIGVLIALGLVMSLKPQT